jgi:WD40 repeat protein
MTTAQEPFNHHRGPITCVAAIPGTGSAISSGYDGAVALVDLETGQLSLLGYHDHLVNRVVVNEEGTLAATASSDYTIHIWDLKQRTRLRILKGHSDDVEDFAFADFPAGVSVSRDWRGLVWNLETGEITRTLVGHQRDVLSVNCHRGRSYTTGDDKTLRVWSNGTGRLEHVWGPFQDETDSCAVDAMRNRIVLGCDDGTLRVFDVATGERVASVKAHESGIKRVAVSPADGRVLSAAYDQRIRLWSGTNLEALRDLDSHRACWERSLNWLPDGAGVIGGTFDGTVVSWDSHTGRVKRESHRYGVGNACINDISADPDGTIATVSDDGIVRIGRLTPDDGGHIIATSAGEQRRSLMNAVFVGIGSTVFTGSHDQRLQSWTRVDNRLVCNLDLRLGEGPINCIRQRQDPSEEVFVACYSGAVVRLSSDGRVLDKFSPHNGAVKALRLHPHEYSGISAGADGTLCTWSHEGRVLQDLPGHMAIVDDVDISPDGNLVSSVGRDFSLKIHDYLTGRLLKCYPLGKKSPKAVCFGTQNTVFVSNYWGQVFGVNLTTGAIMCRQIADNGISSLCRSDRHILASSYDGSAYLLDPETLTPLAQWRLMQQRLWPPSWSAAREDASTIA